MNNVEPKKINVLDKGHVILLDYMGSDLDIAEAARTSYSKGTKKLQEDEGLINYLIKHCHETPLEMIQFKFHVKLPLFVFAQWVRHRMASYNVASYRYSQVPEDYYVPSKERSQTQSLENKQGSSDVESKQSVEFINHIESVSEDALNDYNKLVFNSETNPEGISRELCRIGIPQNWYTEFVTSINLRSLFNFLSLRMDSHAQYEIQEYAKAIYSIVQETHPISIKAFDNHILNSKTLSSNELSIIKKAMPKELLQKYVIEALENNSISKRDSKNLLSIFQK